MRYKFIRLFLILIIVFLVAIGFILIRISYLPFELLKANINTFSSSGNSTLFTEAIFNRIVIKLRLVGFSLFIISGLVYAARQQIQQYISDILISCISFLRGIKYQFVEAFKKEDRIHLYSFFIILIMAITVRIFFLFQPMRYDEAATFTHYASKPLYYGLSSYTFPNNHIFHTFLVHIAYLFLGNKPWVIRLPAFIAGILIVPASYIVVRFFYNKHAALLTAGFVASLSLLIEYSTNARGYTLICLFFLLILALAKFLKENRNSFAWLLFAMLSSLGFYTIPIMLYPFGIVVTWLLLSIVLKDTNISRLLLLRDIFISIILTLLFTFILYLPVIVTSGLKAITGNPFLTSQSWSNFITQFPFSLYSVWGQWNRDIPPWLSIFFVIGFFTSLVFHKRLANHRIPIIQAVIIWLGVILLLQRVIPPNRVWLFLLPLYIGFGISGIVYILKRIIGNFRPAVFAVMCVTISLLLSLNVIRVQSIYNSEETGIFRDAEDITVFLKDYLKHGDRVISTSEAPLEYYFNLHGVAIKHLYSDLDSSRRILLIVNNSDKEALKGFLNEAGLSIFNPDILKIIKKYHSAIIYEIRK